MGLSCCFARVGQPWEKPQYESWEEPKGKENLILLDPPGSQFGTRITRKGCFFPGEV